MQGKVKATPLAGVVPDKEGEYGLSGTLKMSARPILGITPPTPVVYQGAGDSTPIELIGTQLGNEGEKQIFIRIVAGEQEANPASIPEDDGADLE